MSNLSRRSFAVLMGTGAAAAATLPSILAAPSKTILLNSNENPYGPSPNAMQAMRDALAEAFRYPDEPEEALGDAVAKVHGLPRDQVLLGNGSSDILRLAATAFGSRLVTAEPTFEALWFHVPASSVVKIPLDAGYAHDLPKMLDAATSGLVYICNPNNPTATITPKAAMRSFLDTVPATTTVLVDEAYHHYAEGSEYESVVPLVATHPNLVVARTFSKIYAMAGVRCGYALAQKPLIDRMGAAQAFNAMNLMACVAARASLADSAHAVVSKKKNSETRAWLTGELDRLGYHALPSEANFMMIDMRTEVRPVILAFRERGVRVGRVFPALPNHLRVTIGTREEMDRFLETFKAVR